MDTINGYYKWINILNLSTSFSKKVAYFKRWNCHLYAEGENCMNSMRK